MVKIYRQENCIQFMNTFKHFSCINKILSFFSQQEAWDMGIQIKMVGIKRGGVWRVFNCIIQLLLILKSCVHFIKLNRLNSRKCAHEIKKDRYQKRCYNLKHIYIDLSTHPFIIICKRSSKLPYKTLQCFLRFWRVTVTKLWHRLSCPKRNDFGRFHNLK